MVDQPGLSNIETVRAFLRAIESGGDAVAFFHPDAVHTQLPNLIYPRGASAGVDEMRKNAAIGRTLFAHQSYDVTNAVDDEARTVLEVTWRGTLAVPLKALPAGAVITAHCAFVFEWQDGKIIRQRNYDCYEPLS